MKIVKLALLLTFPLFISGFGYMGELPKLGETTNEGAQRQEATIEKRKPSPETPVSIIAPRVSTGYSVNKYSDYIADIKEVEYLLKEIKSILEQEKNPKNKIQLFNAKTFLLGLYVDRFKEKYEDSPEKHYESYKQLVFLNNYLKQVGESNASTAIEPINTVIGVISEAQDL
ncbi:MAG: hypothetical protein A2Y25_10995 [Candidatus Melainabacteria bacterium GWF2_37_15]|nr:MAG: hypothetical protein A2Y25_10995 [Candidatus Melainabacteria bacterium GWF2_37_15]